MTDPSASTVRDAHGRFVPGCSGNPAGKKPGTLNWATRFKGVLDDGEREIAMRKVVERALEGSPVDGRFLFARLDPKPRGRPVEIAVADNAPLLERCQAVFAAMAHGDITPTEAVEAAHVIDTERKLLADVTAAARDVLAITAKATVARDKAAAERAAAETAAAERQAAHAEAAARRAEQAAYWAAQRARSEAACAAAAATAAADPAASDPVSREGEDGLHASCISRPPEPEPPAATDDPLAAEASPEAAAPATPVPEPTFGYHPGHDPIPRRPVVPGPPCPPLARKAGMTKARKLYLYGSARQRRNLKRHGMSVSQQPPPQTARRARSPSPRRSGFCRAAISCRWPRRC
ncbi:MAG: hypothetical protein HY060_01465 [Proteobacteria bacterium]|nr:hypothetical protein [Pseudomonadota bacterium]